MHKTRWPFVVAACPAGHWAGGKTSKQEPKTRTSPGLRILHEVHCHRRGLAGGERLDKPAPKALIVRTIGQQTASSSSSSSTRMGCRPADYPVSNRTNRKYNHASLTLSLEPQMVLPSLCRYLSWHMGTQSNRHHFVRNVRGLGRALSEALRVLLLDESHALAIQALASHSPERCAWHRK